MPVRGNGEEKGMVSGCVASLCVLVLVLGGGGKGM